MTTTIDRWDASTGGSWRYVAAAGRHGVRLPRLLPRGPARTGSCRRSPGRASPDGVALETLLFEDLGDGRTRLHTQSLCDSFEARDAWLRSGMEVGVHDGYAKLDALLAAGESQPTGGAGMSLPTDPAERHRAVAAGFTARVRGASDWDAPAPVPAGAPGTWSPTWSSGSRAS